ncbi:hypothetical protein FBY35_6548 [Streptomyces sp. SLBN-118]|nr:hypothetical protein FBY35_6548 [Streptomyces sp. SLBN-118]
MAGGFPRPPPTAWPPSPASPRPRPDRRGPGGPAAAASRRPERGPASHTPMFLRLRRGARERGRFPAPLCAARAVGLAPPGPPAAASRRPERWGRRPTPHVPAASPWSRRTWRVPPAPGVRGPGAPAVSRRTRRRGRFTTAAGTVRVGTAGLGPHPRRGGGQGPLKRRPRVSRACGQRGPGALGLLPGGWLRGRTSAHRVSRVRGQRGSGPLVVAARWVASRANRKPVGWGGA